MANGGDPEEFRKRDRVEAAVHMRTIAGNRPGDTIKDRITRACERLNWGYARCEEIWRQRARRIEAWELDALRSFVHRDDDWENSQ